MQQDTYTWYITHRNNAETHEFDTTRSDGRGFAEVDATDIAKLTLMSNSSDPHMSLPAHVVTIPQGATPVFFRRRKRILSLTDESVIQGQTVHCIGWKRTTEAVYLFVFDNGETLLTDNLQAV